MSEVTESNTAAIDSEKSNDATPGGLNPGAHSGERFIDNVALRLCDPVKKTIARLFKDCAHSWFSGLGLHFLDVLIDRCHSASTIGRDLAEGDHVNGG